MNYTRGTCEYDPDRPWFMQTVCYWCGDPYANTRDHLTPTSRGGSDDNSNIVLACHSCNARKGAKTEDEYRGWLAAKATA